MIMMVENGVPMRTFIDVGAADGTFGLTVLDAISPGLKVVNLEAQATYEPSLRTIAAVLGHPYRIGAISDRDGEIAVRRPAHEYWLSTATHMGAGATGPESMVLPCRRLDSVRDELAIEGPIFIKMDVEGAELDVLRGAEATLADTCGLLIECPVRNAGGPQFIDIYGFLAARGFSLFDMVRMSHRGSDATLYQFYAVFVAERFDFRGRNPLRSAAQQVEVTEAVVARRSELQEENTRLIASIKLKGVMRD